MKSYDITIIDPNTNREVTHLDIPANRLVNRDGETWFKFDGDYAPNRMVEVITATLVSIERKQAMHAYFNTFGTASE